MIRPFALNAPFSEEKARSLRAGDRVLLSGVIYTARDAAHKRLCQALGENAPLPFPLQDAVIYYAGPSPAREGGIIGSAGPTTSGRMDVYAPRLIALGLRGMIGKGARNERVVEAMKRHGAVYFGAVGGAGALLARCVTRAEVIAYDDLGSEAIRRLEVRDMPLTIVIDSLGDNLYTLGPERYLADAASH